ncbi:MAG: hypothetical protein KDM64_17235, partial [Verrucomicrobiae bacterium]|nr:hypothetical protein [Verrucomicrobiae bacterium]
KNGRILEGQLSEFLDHVLLPEYYDSIKLLHYENWTEILSGNVGHEESLKLAAFLMDRIESVRCKTTSKA